MASKYTHIYTDGGTEKWAFVVARDNALVHEESGTFGISASTTNDDTESEGILRALRYAKTHPANYLLSTDSRAVIAKINGNAANASGSPNIQGIRTLIKSINESSEPESCAVRWERRLSNEFMKRADALCKKG